MSFSLIGVTAGFAPLQKPPGLDISDGFRGYSSNVGLFLRRSLLRATANNARLSSVALGFATLYVQDGVEFFEPPELPELPEPRPHRPSPQSQNEPGCGSDVSRSRTGRGHYP